MPEEPEGQQGGPRRQAGTGGLARLRDRLAGLWRGERSALTRLAGTAFLIRATSAAIAFFSQILLARWMGAFEFGVYVYVWAWTSVLGMLAPLGLGSAAQRFLPEYAQRGTHGLLRGFLAGSRWMTFLIGTLCALLGVLAVALLGERIPAYYLLPFAIAFACVPLYAVAEVQDGIARSYDWVGLALAPDYIARPLIILAVMGGLILAGIPAGATGAVAAAAGATWLTTLVQMLVLDRRLTTRLAHLSGEARLYATSGWLRVALPIFVVDGFYLLLTYADLLILELFVTPEDVAVYFAATKTLAPVAFISFSVAAASAHRFTGLHVSGARDELAHYLADTVRWTFWPSLAAAVVMLALGRLVLSLFGEGFEAGYPLLFVLAVGLLARAAVGPAERLLVMLGEQNACAVIYAAAFAVNVLLCFLLIPRLGLMGAALAPTLAYVVESVLLFLVARRRLGLSASLLGPRGTVGP
ncbi:lipopolysaccharide biosynthesis protein [Bosea sp. 117]|uniref:lipopolysaccharide biosynthesis protein n=1 Tax=Bosea sp. 117 TaxID=1125973 RepID=UPI00068CAF81|nr:lipopolysaccharide biosynthesis protein [Bosea sp. 117]